MNGTATSQDKHLTLDTNYGYYFNKYDLVKVPRTNEVMMVTATSASHINVTRGVGDSGAKAAIVNNDPFLILGSAFQEGSTNDMLITKSTQVERKYNYVQILRKSVELSRSLASSDLYGGDDRTYQRKKKGIELMRDIERLFLYGNMENMIAAAGAGGLDDASLTSSRRMTGGLTEFLTSSTANVTDMSGTMTETEWEGWLRELFMYGESSRTVFCSPLVLSIVSLWAQWLGLSDSDIRVINLTISGKPYNIMVIPR